MNKKGTFRIFCKRCAKTTTHEHTHDTVEGQPDNHIAGTERYVCRNCGHAIFQDSGERMGLEFKFDKVFV